MKNFTKNCLIAAAAFVVVAGSASAQTLVAEIPFSFQAGEKMMAPGTYRVVTRGLGFSAPIIRLANQDNLKSSAILMVNKQDADKEWIAAGTPKLSFDCVDGRCELSKVWDGSDRSALLLRQSSHAKRDIASLSVVTVKAVRAE